ncbi:MAG: hypothetical protein RIB41_09845 [Oceanibaculum nanhaiense]|jgi:hypothetical protein|uniref:hypothetical protein n=1 Tax=Oceanibaculum nanhaiense TaxID=1909734 RepID=UPI0032EBBEF2
MNDKKQKLAQALRDNLLRRKQQARGRADMAGDAEAEKVGDPNASTSGSGDSGRKKATLPIKPDAASG